MVDRITEISGKTMVPASLIVAGWFGASWILDLKKTSDLNAASIEKYRMQNEKILEKLELNSERLARIEEILKYMKGKMQ